jgi:hypothetical protein
MSRKIISGSTAGAIETWDKEQDRLRAMAEKESMVHELARRVKSYIENAFSDEKDRERMLKVVEEILRRQIP